MKEIWKHLEEDANYEISNLGKIRNIKTQIIKSTSFTKKGTYEVCSLNANSYLVHRLVAKYFVENTNPTKYNIVNHLDENTHNNKADNLEWTTNKDNLNYSNVGARNAISNSKFKVIQYDKDGKVIKEWTSKEACYNAGYTQVKSFFCKNGFNRWAYNSFWFSEFEKFDKDRYKPIKLYSLYGINDNKLHITGTTGECAKFLNVPTYRINNAIRNNKLVVRGFKIIVN